MFSEGDLDLIAPEKYDVFLFGGEILPGNVDVKAFGPAYLVKHIEGHLRIYDVPVGRRDYECPFAQGQVFIGDEQFRVEKVLHAQPFACGAGSFGGVE